MKMDTSKVLRLPRKVQVIVWKRRKRRLYFWHVISWWNMLESRSATPAPRNEVTWRLKPPKVTTFAALANGTGIATSRGRLRTAADGCERQRTPQPPNPQSETGTLATHSGKMHQLGGWKSLKPPAKNCGKRTSTLLNVRLIASECLRQGSRLIFHTPLSAWWIWDLPANKSIFLACWYTLPLIAKDQNTYSKSHPHVAKCVDVNGHLTYF